VRAMRAVGRLARSMDISVTPPFHWIALELGYQRPWVAQLLFGPSDHVVLLAGAGTDPRGREVVRFGDPDGRWNPTDVVWSEVLRYRGGIRWRTLIWTC